MKRVRSRHRIPYLVAVALGSSLTFAPLTAAASPPTGGVVEAPAEAPATATPAAATPAASRPKPPEAEPTPSLADPGVWSALSGTDLRVTLADGIFEGKLMGQRENQLVFSRASDGLIVSVPASEVMRIHAKIDRGNGLRAPMPASNGSGLVAGGGVLLGIGVPAVVAGAVMAGVCGGCLFIYLPLLIPGGAMVGAGAGMLKIGLERKKMWYRAVSADRLSDTFGPPMQLQGATLSF